MFRGSASGKIILSGESAVVFGYPGIAVPAPFTVEATMGNTCHPERSRRATRAVLWFDFSHHDTLTVTHHGIENEEYLHRILDAVTKITGPLSGHLTIENTIPIGRGMGSSTALVIAVTRCLFGSLDTLPPRVTPSDFSKKNRIEGRSGSTRDDTLKNIALSIEDTVNHGHSGLDFE